MVKDVLRDIFGTTSEKGLIHATARKFDAKLSVLEKCWETLGIISLHLKYSSGFGYM